jgi:hypothetical protein
MLATFGRQACTRINIAGRCTNHYAKIYSLLGAIHEEPTVLEYVTDAVIKLEQVKEGAGFASHKDPTKPYKDFERQRVVADDYPICHALRAL